MRTHCGRQPESVYCCNRSVHAREKEVGRAVGGGAVRLAGQPVAGEGVELGSEVAVPRS